jgi:hypothetical protein
VASLSACAETYFAQSEQIPTRFALAYGESAEPGRRCTGGRGRHAAAHAGHGRRRGRGGSGEGGLLTHADILSGAQSEDWNRANLLLDTVEELETDRPLGAPTDLLVRLFHEEEPAGLRRRSRCGSAVRAPKTRCATPCRSTARRTSRTDDDRRGRRHRRLPVLRRALRAGPEDLGFEGRMDELARLRAPSGAPAGDRRIST